MQMLLLSGWLTSLCTTIIAVQLASSCRAVFSGHLVDQVFFQLNCWVVDFRARLFLFLLARIDAAMFSHCRRCGHCEATFPLVLNGDLLTFEG